MNVPSRRSLFLICGVALAAVSVPSESKAIFHWFGGGCCGRTTYAPTTAYCNPCGAQTCQYVPQTYYRQQVVNVPVTTYRPVASCGPCGGTTVMRPVTTYQQQVQMIPYNSYRLVYSNPVVAAPPAANYYTPSTTSAASCCTPAVAPASYTAPATTYGAPATAAPSLSTPPASSTTPPQTYAPSNGEQYESARPSDSTQPQQNSGSDQGPELRMTPIPDNQTGSRPTNEPQQGSHRHNLDSTRTTSYTAADRGWSYMPVANTTGAIEPANTSAATVPAWVANQRAVPAAPKLDDGGWRPASR